MSANKENAAEKPMFVLMFAGFGCFLLSFIGMGLGPWISLAATMEPPEELAANPYKDENGETNAIGRGRETYINEGCWHCHSQFVRPVANEEFRYGPVSEAWESMYDVPNTFGTRRIGPDLSREAGRRSDDWHLAHLWNPRSTVPRSIMPKYTWLFEKDGETWKPTDKANDLVAYLQYLGIAKKEEVRKMVWPSRVVVAGAPQLTDAHSRRGEELFNKHCTGCHGENGDGVGLAKDFLAPSAADLTTRYLPREEVFRVLFMGSEGSAMPSFSELTEKDLWALAQYVHELGKDVRKPALKTAEDSAAVERGRAVFGKNGCKSCHGESGLVPEAMEGLKPAPKHFRDRVYTADYIAHVLDNGRAGTSMGKYPQITGQDRSDLVAFLNSLFDKQKYKEE
ncbi:MAG: cbb3-type cytochrome c oxidase subunit II [Planctomycetes bacterium]|nr:cbb3-type cytochrome c oxidase subunit II [Planctomycetota bacterium]MCA8944967.1 cbb3-type cytochrome c oxidase subunit II [Planctomycetota bacterium]